MPTVLLVDDSPVVRRVLTRRLQAAGYQVQAAASASDARTVDPASLDCAVVDIELLDGSGSDLAADLLQRRPSLPLAFFTAGASADILESARAHGPIFAKPDIDGLMRWVTGTLQPPPTK